MCKTNPAASVHHVTRLRDIVDGFEREYNTTIKFKFNVFRRRYTFALSHQERDFVHYHNQHLDTLFTCHSCNSSLH